MATERSVGCAFVVKRLSAAVEVNAYILKLCGNRSQALSYVGIHPKRFYVGINPKPLRVMWESTTPRSKTNIMMLTFAEPKNNQTHRMPLLVLDKMLHDGGPYLPSEPRSPSLRSGGNNG